MQKELWEHKLEQYKGLPQAVGSESIEHKDLRYRQISDIFFGDTNFSLLDVGAGVGDYFGYLSRIFPEKKITYQGSEIVPEFCNLAREKYPEISINTMNILEDDIESYDYVIMSGIFHQRGETTLVEWRHCMRDMLIKAFQICKKGIAFNVLSNYAEYEREGNFYADLHELQDFIVRSLSRFYTLNHAYPLFEATIFVYQPRVIRERYPSNLFTKYMCDL